MNLSCLDFLFLSASWVSLRAVASEMLNMDTGHLIIRRKVGFLCHSAFSQLYVSPGTGQPPVAEWIAPVEEVGFAVVIFSTFSLLSPCGLLIPQAWEPQTCLPLFCPAIGRKNPFINQG